MITKKKVARLAKSIDIAIAGAIRAEREACAQIAEEFALEVDGRKELPTDREENGPGDCTASDIAAAIRART